MNGFDLEKLEKYGWGTKMLIEELTDKYGMSFFEVSRIVCEPMWLRHDEDMEEMIRDASVHSRSRYEHYFGRLETKMMFESKD